MKLLIHNWATHQTYRRDRSQPPWIKVHRNIFLSPKWVQLSDAQKGQLVSIWVLAADKDGSIPSDPAMVKKLCGLDKNPDLETFILLGLIERDATLASGRRHSDATVTPFIENNDGSESEVESDIEPDTEPRAAARECPKKKAQEVLTYWNTEHNRNISVVEKIEARIKQGATVEDCKMVIDFKTSAWIGTKFQKNLQPATLFAPSHFKDYLSEAREGGVEQKYESF